MSTGGLEGVIVIRIVSETQLSGQQRCVAHYTLYSRLLTILGQCWEDGKISPCVPCSICDDNISQVSSMGQGEGGEKCNKILLKNNIYSDQGPVPDVGITLPRGGHQANIFSFKWSKTQLFVDPNLTVSDSESMKVQVRRLEQSISHVIIAPPLLGSLHQLNMWW